MRFIGPRLIPALGLLMFAAAAPASAEWFADLYGGGSHTPRSDFTMVIGSPSAPADHVFHDVEWDPSGEYGVRAGYWLESVPWYGVGLDAFRFAANVPRQNVDTTIFGATAPLTLQPIDFSISALGFDVVRLRYPFLVSAQYPKGRFQPYVTAGPALFRVKVTNKGNGELTGDTASDTVTGYKLGGGLSWQLSKDVALFGEYRYTHFHAEPVLNGAITGARVPLKFDLDTHHVVAGLSFRF